MEDNTKIIAHWAQRLDFDLDRFKASTNTILTGYRENEFQIFRTTKNSLIKVPENTEIDFLVSNKAFSAIGKESRFEVKEIYHSYFLKDRKALPKDVENIQIIDESKIPALSMLRDSCSKRDNELGEVGADDPLKIGYFENDQCLAAASLIYYGDVADVGVIVHPNARNRGLGKKVVNEICRQGIEKGKIIHYGAILQNTGSIKLAESFSFTLACIIEEGLIKQSRK